MVTTLDHLDPLFVKCHTQTLGKDCHHDTRHPCHIFFVEYEFSTRQSFCRVSDRNHSTKNTSAVVFKTSLETQIHLRIGEDEGENYFSCGRALSTSAVKPFCLPQLRFKPAATEKKSLVEPKHHCKHCHTITHRQSKDMCSAEV